MTEAVPTSFIQLLDNDDYFSCCTSLYENDLLKFLLGESFHPGGLDLTLELASLMDLTASDIVLDLACGFGQSLQVIQKEYQVTGIGIDFSFKNLKFASESATKTSSSSRLHFIQGDSQKLPLRKESMNKIFSECSFCIFPNKQTVTTEIKRLLTNNGNYTMSDVSRINSWPNEVRTMFYRVACIADAKTKEEYKEFFEMAGFENIEIYDRKDVILEFYSTLKKKTMFMNIAAGFDKLAKNRFGLDKVDFKELNKNIDFVKEFVEKKYGSYIIFQAFKQNG